MPGLDRGRILIVGLGIAGTTLAWWLADAGWDVTVVEHAPAPRSGGYMIDFWGLGYDVATRMGLEGQLRAVGYQIDRLELVRDDGRAIAMINAGAVRDVAHGRFVSLMRGDLAEILLRNLQDRVQLVFKDYIVQMSERVDTVEVTFAHAGKASFDLVIGADGAHSDLRTAMFSEETERPLDFWTAAFSVDHYPHRDPNAYVSYTQVGRQVARYALRSGRTAFFFMFRRPGREIEFPKSLRAQMDWLRDAFRRDGWECAEILAAMTGCRDFYFDAVSQVSPPAWSRDRIALVGDAAYCPSLLAGEGASFAMAGAYVLAGELNTGQDFATAFARYERRLRPMIEEKQRGALALGGWFAPKTVLGLWARNGISRLASLPGVDRLMIQRLASTRFSLPSYRPGAANS
jgi:2-polyprenyl-6-methoxyphenol hydroxylase-like FAD-dependent oxidoreductase